MNMKNLTPDEQKIQQRCDGATAGPWLHEYSGNGKEILGNGSRVAYVADHADFVYDSYFIAHSREDIPALLQTVSDLRGEVVAMEDQMIENATELFAALESSEKAKELLRRILPLAYEHCASDWPKDTNAFLAGGEK